MSSVQSLVRGVQGTYSYFFTCQNLFIYFTGIGTSHRLLPSYKLLHSVCYNSTSSSIICRSAGSEEE